MQIMRTLSGVLGLLAFVAGALQITPINNLYALSPWGIGFQFGVGCFLAYSIGRARAGEQFSWSEEITWAIVELVLFILIALTPIQAGAFLVAHTAKLCVATGLVIFITNLMQ